ncbi:MAG: DUF2782 domain-containing protein [Gammaproteobacteria bacterium]|nr:MAG: DUF2782 domain-containing protein [Gammaproteobacteria bacterium]
MPILILLMALFAASPSFGETPSEAPPPPVEQGEEMAPEVTIVPQKGGVIYEYRRGGQLYMIKVVPQVGLPYYLIDTDADGVWDKRLDDIAPYSVPQWILFQW